MTLPEYQAWCWEGDGTYQVARLRLKWVIDGLAREDEYARMRGEQTARTQWKGWQGGEADPEDSVEGWEDDGDPAAA